MKIEKKEYGFCKTLDTEILTNIGVKPLSDVVPGDYVYSAIDGSELLVTEVQRKEASTQDAWVVKYDDGRMLIRLSGQKVVINLIANDCMEVNELRSYLSKSNIPVINHMAGIPESKKCNKRLEEANIWFPGIMTYPQKKDSLMNADILYIAAAFIIYGSPESEYINLPDNQHSKDWLDNIINSGITAKFDISRFMMSSLENGETALFPTRLTVMDDDPVNCLITWDELFNRINVEMSRRDEQFYYLKSFYNELLMTDAHRRIAFIQGAFDFGYNQEESPEDRIRVKIPMWSFSCIMKLLRSLGIMADYDYDSDNLTHEDKTILTTSPGNYFVTIEDVTKITELFRDPRYLQHAIELKSHQGSQPFRWCVTPKGVVPYNVLPTSPFTTYSVAELRVENPKTKETGLPFLTANFVPVPSI